ncbi:MAG: TraB/GumN family protein [Pseudomonadota bacterium]
MSEMTWKTACIASIACLLAACGGQVTGPNALADIAEDDAAPPVWTISDDDTTIHFFGTVHILPPDVEWRSPAFDAAFEAADAVYFEADTQSANAQVEALSAITSTGFFTDGRTLTEVLDDAEEKEVVEALDILGAPIASFNPQKPWLAGLNLQSMFAIARGYETDAGVEVVLTKDAEAAGKPLRFLEGVAEQIGILAGIPEDDQIAFLVASAISIEDEPEALDLLVAEWAEGDIDALSAMVADVDAFGAQEVYDALLTTRNENWTGQVEALLDDEAGTFLIAVGAAHLVGPDSLPAMLRARGYEVEGP